MIARRALVLAVLGAAVALAFAPAGSASPYLRYGIQDDAWLASGPGGTIESRIDRLDRMGVDVVRYTLRWDEIARRKPANSRDDADPAYRWGVADDVLNGLRTQGMGTVVTLLGTPRWANGGRSFNWAPASKYSLANFAYSAAKRYPWVRDWLVWNEPNQRRWLRPTSARVYVKTLLNPAYVQLHKANPANRVGGGVTAPRGNIGGVSPVSWIRGMRAARARLDAYAHHPYPTDPRYETPWTGGCSHCETITMATLGRLLFEVRRNLGPKRIWLTEYGYQTNPPDGVLGVSTATQAAYLSSAARRAYSAPAVDMLINFLVLDDRPLGGWQSGLFRVDGVAKPAYSAFRLPLTQASRSGLRTDVWGQVRPRSGRQRYRLQQSRGGRWHWIGATRWTSARGFFSATVAAGKGSRLRMWSPGDGTYSRVVGVR